MEGRGKGLIQRGRIRKNECIKDDFIVDNDEESNDIEDLDDNDDQGDSRNFRERQNNSNR